MSDTPHTCPVCKGNGMVPNGFYNQTTGAWATSSITPDQCRSCLGSGIIWSSSPEQIPYHSYPPFHQIEKQGRIENE